MFAVVIIEPEAGFVPEFSSKDPLSGKVVRVFASEAEILAFIGEGEYTPKLFKKPELSLNVAINVVFGWNDTEIREPGKWGGQYRWAIVSDRVPMIGTEFEVVHNETIEQAKQFFLLSEALTATYAVAINT